MMTVQVVIVVQTTNVCKGLSMGVLLIIVITMIIVGVSILIIVTQTDFIRNVASMISEWLTFDLP